MTAQTSWRRRFASVTATATAVLLAASGALMAPAIANAEEPEAPVAVTEAAVVAEDAPEAVAEAAAPAGAVSASVKTIVPNATLTLQVEATGLPDVKGAYAALIEAGTASSVTAAGGYTEFAMPFPKVAAGASSFEIPVAVEKLDRTKQYEVLVWKQHSDTLPENIYALGSVEITNAQWHELYGTSAPAITVEPNDELNRDGQTVTVRGTGYNPNQPIYVTTCADIGLESLNFNYIMGGCRDGAKQISLGATPGAGSDAFAEDGSFETQLTVQPKAGAAVTSVFTIANHTAMADRSQDARAVLNFAAPRVPEVTAVVSGTSKTELTVSVELKNIFAEDGAYVTVVEAGKMGQIAEDAQGIAPQWVRGKQFKDGAASVKLALPGQELDRKKQYEVISWPTKSNPTAENLYGTASLTVSKQEWDAVVTKIPFTDVKPGDQHYREIAWMYNNDVSPGIPQADGTVKYAPKSKVTRGQMAAFLFRQNSEPGYKAPAKSPFTDVKTTDKFYKEIAWMNDEKITTGVKQSNGTRKFLPQGGVTRETMAAFLYRMDSGKKPAAPKVSPFADMKPGDRFYKEIAWMYSTGLSTGIKQSSGKPKYAPKNSVTRGSMAAFLYRSDQR